MPVYYFDIDDSRQKFIDNDGKELTGPEAARDQAFSLLPQFAKEALTGAGSREVTVIVRNDAGDTVFMATMTLRSEWLIAP